MLAKLSSQQVPQTRLDALVAASGDAFTGCRKYSKTISQPVTPNYTDPMAPLSVTLVVPAESLF